MAAMIDIPFWSSAEAGSVVGVTSSGATTAAAEAADAYFRGKNLVS
jgi:hypothetical protein